MAERHLSRSPDHARSLVRRAPSVAGGRGSDVGRPGLGDPVGQHASAIGNLETLRRLESAGVQPKLDVSHPTDAHEVEADRVAEQVMSMPVDRAAEAPTDEEETVATRLDRAAEPEEEVATRLDRAAEPEEQETVATRLDRAAEPEEEEVATRLDRAAEPEEEEVATRLDRAAEPPTDEEETVATRLDRAAEPEEEEVATKADGAPAMTPAIESGINTSRAGGQPLEASERSFFEPRFGRDLSGTKVHTDPQAARLASDMNAQAFTVGRDIYMGAGRYQPGTESGRSLLAHELTHTVQQQPGAKLDRRPARITPTPGHVGRQVQRANGGAAAAGPGAPTTPVFYLPQVKARHRPLYQAWAARGVLKRSKNFDRDSSPENTPDQRDTVWRPAVRAELEQQGSILKKLDLDQAFTGQKTLNTPRGGITGTREQLLEAIAIPQWDRRKGPANFEVDHIVELQAAGWPGGEGNTVPNMELLTKSANASAGGKTRGNIRHSVEESLGRQGRPNAAPDVNAEVASTDIVFGSVELGSGPTAGGDREAASQWWTYDEIIHGAHLPDVTPVGNVGEQGTATSLALFSPLTVNAAGEQVGGRALLTNLAQGSQLEFPISGRRATSVAGLRMSKGTLNDGYTAAGAETQIGNIEATWALPPTFNAPAAPFNLPIHKMPTNQYGGFIGTVPPLALNFPPMSPIQFDSVGMDGFGLTAVGRLSPTIPLISKVPIEVRLTGSNIEFGIYYTATDLDLPVPGLQIDEATLGVFYSTRDGLGAEGSVDLSIPKVGRGSLLARATRSAGLELEGSFDFDPGLFDEASIRIWYRNQAFGGSGRLAITNPDKIPGIRSARIEALFDAGRFSATGSVLPNIPGIEQASLTVTHSEQEGLVIGGTVNLSSDIPAIESGTVDITLRKLTEEEGWKVRASGRARPRIPGVDSEIVVTYEDGIFTAEATAAYNRGMLAGSLRIGATNRPVDESGNPGEGPTPELRAFGGGSLTLTLAPWLAATATVRLTPEGEVEVTGRIGLPSTLEVFPAKRYDRNIFRVNLDIPIVGVSVAGQRIGIFATIGGGLDLTAGFGPGQLRDLHLEVTYNPDHEEDTLVQGGAEFIVPADAGLRLFVTGALGAGIPVVSASAGLEIGGQLGIEGAARAAVQVAWTPTTGLDLTAEAEIYAEPVFKFDITGFVKVEADLLFTEIELYSKRWRLAQFEYGSGLRLGAKFPIHYIEGQPFDVSMDDIEFQVPDIDPMQLLSGLIDQLA